MARMGFIHDKLDIKLLVLYLLSRTSAPIDFATLTDLAMCDPGVDYFQFAEAVNELTQSEHIALTDGLYDITEKGRRNIADCESSLSPVVRKRCDERLLPLNAELRRHAQVRASVSESSNGEFLLSLSLDDDAGNLLALSLVTASRTQGEQMAKHFQNHPEQVYHSILQALLHSESEDTEPYE